MLFILLFDPLQFVNLYHVWLEMLALIITSTLAILTFVFLVRQHKLQETNIKLAAYDRRLKIYNTLHDFAANISSVNTQMQTKFLWDTREAEFLFNDKEIQKIIDDLYMESINMEAIKDHLSNSNIKEEKRLKLVDKEHELLGWYGNQHANINKLFKKYLNLEK